MFISDVAARSKGLLKDLRGGVSTKEVFQKECAHWLMEDESLNDLKPKPLPRKSVEVMQFEMLPREKSSKKKYKKEEEQEVDSEFRDMIERFEKEMHNSNLPRFHFS